MKIFIIALAVLAVLILAVYINHGIQLKKESDFFVPLGQMVDVAGHNMSVYVEGQGNITLVFMSGGGTCSPILDFKSLYALLSDQHQIAVVEKFGYGFSDIVAKSRNIDSVLEDTRAALTSAGLSAPYVLCPHSLSGLEALYWSQKYPDEVAAIIGLDMAVPQYYDGLQMNIPLLKVASWLADIGMTRLIPGIANSDAIAHGTLTEQEKKIYKAIFYRRTATVSMINEAEAVKANAEKVASLGIPQLPMLLFISDGSGVTGFTKETWRKIPMAYLSHVNGGQYIELECPHYVHNYEYEMMSERIVLFLSEQH